MTYYVLSCGVNQGPGSLPLGYAESDATAVADFFRSSAGPPGAIVMELLGKGATVSAIKDALLIIAMTKPAHFVLYFAGHGSTDGALASDNELSYEFLIPYIRRIQAPHTIIILDVCQAASYLGFLKEAQIISGRAVSTQSWLLALSRATRGTRLIFSTEADRSAGERHDIKGGVFTYAFLSALRRCKGTIRIGGDAWVSDQVAFAAAKFIIANELGIVQQPVERGLTGDFPLALSQAHEPIGFAHFLQTTPAQDALEISFVLVDRRNLGTTLHWTVNNASGDAITTGVDVVRPDGTTELFSFEIACPHAAIRADPGTRFNRAIYENAYLEWVLTLRDENDAALESKVVPFLYEW